MSRYRGRYHHMTSPAQGRVGGMSDFYWLKTPRSFSCSKASTRHCAYPAISAEHQLVSAEDMGMSFSALSREVNKKSALTVAGDHLPIPDIRRHAPAATVGVLWRLGRVEDSSLTRSTSFFASITGSERTRGEGTAASVDSCFGSSGEAPASLSGGWKFINEASYDPPLTDRGVN
ncbi:unnamed protein product [Spodoptera exigua]|nr:unnamed protein product [Spodoptera exigua]